MSSQFLLAKIASENLLDTLNALDGQVRDMGLHEFNADLIEQHFPDADNMEDAELLDVIRETLLDDIKECILRVTGEHASDYAYFKVKGVEILCSGGFSYGDTPCDFFDSLCRVSYLL